MKAQPSYLRSLISPEKKKGRRKRMDDDIWDPLEEVEMEDLDSSED